MPARRKRRKELGVDVIWRGPLREDDRASQVSEVEGFVTRGVSGIVLAPLDEAALAPPVADATRSKIPVVDHRLGAEGRRLRQLRRDRQPPGRPLAGDAARRAAARNAARS